MEFDFGILQVFLGSLTSLSACLWHIYLFIWYIYYYLHLAEVCCERHLQDPQRGSLGAAPCPTKELCPFSVPAPLHLLWDLGIADPSSSQKVAAAAMQAMGLLGNTHTGFAGKDAVCVAQSLLFPEAQSFKVSLILLCRFGAPVP